MHRCARVTYADKAITDCCAVDTHPRVIPARILASATARTGTVDWPRGAPDCVVEGRNLTQVRGLPQMLAVRTGHAHWSEELAEFESPPSSSNVQSDWLPPWRPYLPRAPDAPTASPCCRAVLWAP